MNDRFRFRAWDKWKHTYIYDAQDTWDNEWAEFFGLMVDDSHGSRFAVEQCTGLKDKNGNLIHEGDICCDYKYGVNIVVKFGAISFKKISEYDNSIRDVTCECFYFEELETGKKLNVLRQIHNIPEDDWKIIGNIHENPELLEAI